MAAPLRVLHPTPLSGVSSGHGQSGRILPAASASRSGQDATPNPLLGIGLKILAALAFTIMSAGIKVLGPEYPTGEIVFFRSAFALVPLAAWLGLRGHFVDSVRTSDLKGHVLRGIIGSCGMFAGFAGLSFLPLSHSVAIGYAAPLMTVVLAAIVLRERVRGYRWSAVVVGFAGVLVMLAPHLGLGGTAPAVAPGILFALLGAACAAVATIQVRRLTATEKTGAIVLYFTLLTTALGLVTAVLGWRTPTAHQLPLLIGIGILGGIGQILQTQSFRYADASLIAPFDYISMLWALLLGFFIFGEWPEPTILFGGAIVAGAGIFVIWREHRLGLVRAKSVELGAQRAT